MAIKGRKIAGKNKGKAAAPKAAAPARAPRTLRQTIKDRALPEQLAGIRRGNQGLRGTGTRRIPASYSAGGIGIGNRLNRYLTAEQRRGDFTDRTSRKELTRRTALRGSTSGNAGGTTARTTPATGNAGGGKKSSDNSKNKGSRTTAATAATAPAVRPSSNGI